MEPTTAVQPLVNYGFSDEDIVIMPPAADDAEWHSRRAFCIGGSDVGAIMGLNDHKTALQVYREKVDHIIPDLSDNVFIKKGKTLEPVIFENWVVPKMKELGYRAIRPDVIFSNHRFPFIQCNLDGAAISSDKESCIIEIKWVSPWGAANWDGDDYCGIPKSYYAQVQTYMAVTGAPKAFVFALFDDEWECKMYEIPRDNTFIDNLLKATKTFYTANMQMEIPPKPAYGKDDAAEVCATLESDVTPHATEEFTDLICEYLQAQKALKDATQWESKLKQQLFVRYAAGERSLLTNVDVKFKSSTMTRFDTTEFKAAHPDLYAQFLKQYPTSRICVNTKKK